MEMINRLNGDALDSAEFVKRLKAIEQDNATLAQQLHEGRGSENRQQRRARERAEKNAAQRLAKARP